MKKVMMVGIATLMLAVTAVMAVEYAVSSTQYGEPTVRFVSGNTPMPEGAVYPIPTNLRNKQLFDLEIDGGVLREKTAQEKADYAAAKAAAEAQAMTDWNNSKTNHADIILWENRFMMRLGQVNGILMSEGITTNALTPATAIPSMVATYIIQATNTQASSVGIALGECDVWATKITVDAIGTPPDGSSVREHITSHP